MVGQDVWGSFSALYPLRCQNVKLRSKGVWIFLGLGSPCSMNWRQASSYTCITWLPQSWSFLTQSPAWVSLALPSSLLIFHNHCLLRQPNPSPSPFRLTMGFQLPPHPRNCSPTMGPPGGPGLFKASDILCPFPQPPNLSFSQSEFCKPLSKIPDGADSLEFRKPGYETGDKWCYAPPLPLWPLAPAFPADHSLSTGPSLPARTTSCGQELSLPPCFYFLTPSLNCLSSELLQEPPAAFPSSNSSSSLLPQCVLSSLTDCITLGGNLPTHSPAVLSMDLARGVSLGSQVLLLDGGSCDQFWEFEVPEE